MSAAGPALLILSETPLLSDVGSWVVLLQPKATLWAGFLPLPRRISHFLEHRPVPLPQNCFLNFTRPCVAGGRCEYRGMCVHLCVSVYKCVFLYVPLCACTCAFVSVSV